LPHLLGIFARSLSGEGPEFLYEMSLVEVPASVSKRGKIGLGVKHEAPLGLLETERSRENLWRSANNLLEPSLDLPDRRVTMVGKIFDSALTLGVIQELRRGLHELEIVSVRQCLLNQELLKRCPGIVILPLRDMAFEPSHERFPVRAEGCHRIADGAELIVQ